MSRIDDLIRHHCPAGVEYRAIGEVGQLVRGNGMPKADFVESGVGCIHYGQIYTYYRTWATSTISFVPPDKAAKLAKVDPGDVIVTNTSENIGDVCKAVAWLGSEQIVTGGHATVLKHDQDPKFLAYYLQTAQFHADKKRYVTGTKVMDVSAKRLAMIRVPLPPREVQREIVRVLDLFQALEAELEAELEARRGQYAHYRDSLLGLEGVESQSFSLSEVMELVIDHRGKTPKKLGGDWAETGHRVISARNFQRGTVDANDHHYISEDIYLAWMRQPLRRGDVLLTSEAPLGAVAYLDDEVDWALGQRVFGLRPRIDVLNGRFLYHMLAAGPPRRDLLRRATGSTVTGIRQAELVKVEISVPSLEQQMRIATALDDFDAIVNDLTIGLPAELAARRTQYEYYRDRLLTFEEAV